MTDPAATDVLFYHLTESRLEDALPVLIEKSLQRGWRVVVRTGGEERRDALDRYLWTYRQDSFLPHGTDIAADAERQPVLLSAGAGDANGADVCFLVDGAEPADVERFVRVAFLFDGHDRAQLEAARSRWKELKDAGNAVSYWQQTRDGRWEKKA